MLVLKFDSLVNTAICGFEVDLEMSRARQYQLLTPENQLSAETDAQNLLVHRPQLQGQREPAPPALVLPFCFCF
jgi:hypothetical protein